MHTCIVFFKKTTILRKLDLTLTGLIKEPTSRLLPFKLNAYTKTANEQHKPGAELSLPYPEEILSPKRRFYLQETF
jgi:hypothetical protein